MGCGVSGPHLEDGQLLGEHRPQIGGPTSGPGSPGWLGLLPGHLGTHRDQHHQDKQGGPAWARPWTVRVLLIPGDQTPGTPRLLVQVTPGRFPGPDRPGASAAGNSLGRTPSPWTPSCCPRPIEGSLAAAPAWSRGSPCRIRLTGAVLTRPARRPSQNNRPGPEPGRPLPLARGERRKGTEKRGTAEAADQPCLLLPVLIQTLSLQLLPFEFIPFLNLQISVEVGQLQRRKVQLREERKRGRLTTSRVVTNGSRKKLTSEKR